MSRYDVIIAGAGAGGVFAAYEFTKLNSTAIILIVDKGSHLEKSECPMKK